MNYNRIESVVKFMIENNIPFEFQNNAIFWRGLEIQALDYEFMIMTPFCEMESYNFDGLIDIVREVEELEIVA